MVLSNRYLTLPVMIGLVVLAHWAPAMGATKTKHRCTSAVRLTGSERWAQP
jgi:hypothetical protein